MSHIRGHLQRFAGVFVRDVPHPGTSPTFCGCFRPRCPTFRDISNGLPVFLHEMSHIQGHLQRFAGVFARDVPHSGTSPTFCRCFCTRCPTFGDISNVLPVFLHEMSHIQGHLQRFAGVFARDVPHSGTSPTFYPCFRPRCPTFGDISNVLPVFSSEMSHIRGHLQRFACVFARDVPHPGTSPTLLGLEGIGVVERAVLRHLLTTKWLRDRNP